MESSNNINEKVLKGETEENAADCCEPTCCDESELDSSEKIKEVVRDKYAEIVKQAEAKEKTSGCCEPTGCCGSSEIDYSVFNDDYSHLEGYVADADLNLGCGMPTEFAGINKGDTVVDLGSGAGNDVLWPEHWLVTKARLLELTLPKK